MATLTTDQFLDGGIARTAGEVMTYNGGRLTVRTDTRWHANAPAAMTGTLGGASVISTSLGGGLIIDGRNVRWLAFSAGAGVVPAIGTTITQGGVSGYLLGVWSSLTAAPTAVGAAMPATGFLKFREVTAGPFAAGALTGITANADGADVVGWIEVVADQAFNLSVPRLGIFQTRGDWYVLGTGSGARGQTFQLPTNGGGGSVPGCWVETGVATDVYEFWPAIRVVTQWTSFRLSTDRRARFCENVGGGVVRFGSDGTNNIGDLPVTGARIRVPNVFLRQCTTAARATNADPHATLATRPDFTTTNAGVIDMENALTDWYLSFAQPYSVKLRHVGTFDTVVISECATPLDLDDGGTGMFSGLDTPALSLTSNFAGGIVRDWRCERGNAAGANDHSCVVSNCNGQVFTRVQAGILDYARSTGLPFSFSQCNGVTLDSCTACNGPVAMATCSDVTITNHNHVDRYTGGTIATTPYYAIQLSAKCTDVVIDGVVFGFGVVADCHPYNGILSLATCDRVTLRNCGTRAVVLSGGTANNPAYVFATTGNCTDIRVQRCYLQPTRTAPWTTVNSDKNITCESVLGDFADTATQAGLNMRVTGGSGTNATTGQASVYGTHWGDGFTSNTVGRLWWDMSEATAETAPYVTTNFSGASGFTSAGGCALVVVGNSLTLEHPQFIKGHTSFQNAAPTLTGTLTGNQTYEYDLDTGSGFTGTWKVLNGANLSGETISPTGFKMRLRITCATANTTNLVTNVRILTNSTLAAQTDNLYPLDLATLQLTGLKNPSEVRLYVAGTQTQVPGTGEEDVVDGVFSTQLDPSEYPSLDISVLSLGYQNLRYLAQSLPAEGLTIPVVQQVDRQYGNP